MDKCNLCGNETDSLTHQIEQTVIKMIKNANPEWVAEDGSCQPCIEHYQGLDDAVQIRDSE